jgi:hypothetical protein
MMKFVSRQGQQTETRLGRREEDVAMLNRKLGVKISEYYRHI